MHHSTSFQHLKGVRERLRLNYSSAQYAEVMDVLLMRAIEPMARQTRVLDQLLPGVAAWASHNPSRKISSVLDKHELLHLLCLYPLAPARSKARMLTNMRLERSILAYALDLFLGACDSLPGHWPDMHPPELAVAVGWRLSGDDQRDCTSLWALWSEVRYWYDLYLDFRGQVAEKFTRLALMRARETAMILDHPSLDDVIQQYLMAIQRALDKFDPALGSLASYIGQWFLDARTTCRRDLGAPTVSLDQLMDDGLELGGVSADVMTTIITKQEIERVRQIARVVDPIGFGRLALELDEPVKPLCPIL